MGPDAALVKRRGRPAGPAPMRRFAILLSLHPVADADLIAALDAAPRGRRATLLREWLRAGRPADVGATPDERPNLEGLGLEL